MPEVCNLDTATGTEVSHVDSLSSFLVNVIRDCSVRQDTVNGQNSADIVSNKLRETSEESCSCDMPFNTAGSCH